MKAARHRVRRARSPSPTVPDPAPGPREVVVAGRRLRALRHRPAHPRRASSRPRCRSCPGTSSPARWSAVGTRRHRAARSATGWPSTRRCTATSAATADAAATTCASAGRRSASPRPGGAAEYARGARWPTACGCPSTYAPQDAALIEPLSCAVRGYDVLRPALGAHVPDLRLRHDGPDDAGAGQADRRGQRRRGRPQPDPAGDGPASWAARPPATSADELDRPQRLGRRHRRHRATRRPSRTGWAGWPRPARSCSSASPTTRRAATHRAVPDLQPGDHASPARWPCCTASSGPRNCSPRRAATRRSSSATGCRWRSTRPRWSSSGPGVGRKIQVMPHK